MLAVPSTEPLVDFAGTEGVTPADSLTEVDPELLNCLVG